MSETNEAQNLSNIRQVFYDEILPLAKKMQQEGKLFFQVNTNPNKNTYYTNRVHRQISQEDFEAVAYKSGEDIAIVLETLWTSQGYPELCSLIPSLSGLANRIRLLENHSDVVSPFIYVMF